jgi:hypothetical protein
MLLAFFHPHHYHPHSRALSIKTSLLPRERFNPAFLPDPFLSLSSLSTKIHFQIDWMCAVEMEELIRPESALSSSAQEMKGKLHFSLKLQIGLHCSSSGSVCVVWINIFIEPFCIFPMPLPNSKYICILAISALSVFLTNVYKYVKCISRTIQHKASSSFVSLSQGLVNGSQFAESANTLFWTGKSEYI